ncbi:NADP-dependent malic enzyme [Halalkalibacter sp. APA_J-10(15)]|uniref:NAD(P)-dependent malic enzyme n=1 Tax=unclassified Halalkalibacter TaxID=2893063 RepID=UPI001FF5C7CF|nr:malic enzyme-like NAD(P)-binding protein [Halalkalibacter sp. APA_J-10(15)]MCK0471337.1 NAD-dependent malic enzyme [Halalkalibacter sp. APA_J-10(15)]
MTSFKDEALKIHRKHRGKLEAKAKVPVQNAHDLSLVYSPGVADPCEEIHRNREKVYEYTMKGNFVAVVSNGTAVLGLGNIGPEASLPVMEGKAVLFKSFAGVDAFPLCIKTKQVEEIVMTVKQLEPTFAGINLEDFAAPHCFEVERRLKEEMNIPVFHDDQHGTAIVTLAGLLNACKLTGRKLETAKIIVNGAGAAGIAIIKLLRSMGAKQTILCDSRGAIYKSRQEGMNKQKLEVATFTNPTQQKGKLESVVKDADIFVGVSVEGVLTKEMVQRMNPEPIIFAMANPNPEIAPEDALVAGAKVIGTGRSDYPNQVNNVLAFPGVFRGAIDVRATDINEEMKAAAVYAIANLIEGELDSNYVIPAPFDKRVSPAVAAAVAKAAIDSGVATVHTDPKEVAKRTAEMAIIQPDMN